MPAKVLKEFLDHEHVKYAAIQHSPAYTAREVALSSHVLSRDFAKTVVVHIEGQLAMLVLPANRKIMLSDLRQMLDAEKVNLATEEELKQLFPDCEIGAMPPFGNLYGLEVYVAPSLAAEPEIAFNAGTHTEVIKMAYPDFERLVHPRVLAFAS
jgi:Ala-tRNA(Pro) deacylase